MDIHRRKFIQQAGLGVAAVAGVAMFGKTLSGLFVRSALAAPATTYEVTHTSAEWHKILTQAQYDVLRDQGTEAPYSSPLNNEHRAGTFFCAGCRLPAFSSTTKFDSGTGWPSFYAPLDNAVATTTDFKLIVPRTEVHCRRCGGHLGHVFDDGPKPTGKRYCMNGIAMQFIPTA